MTPRHPQPGFTRTTSGEWEHQRGLPDDPGMTPAEIHGHPEATAALDEPLARSLRLRVPVLATIYLASRLGGQPTSSVTPTQVLVTAGLAVLAIVLAFRAIPGWPGNPIFAGGLAAIAIEALVRGSAGCPEPRPGARGGGCRGASPPLGDDRAAAVIGPWLVAATVGLGDWRLDDHVAAQLVVAGAIGAVVFEARHGSVGALMAARGVLHALALTDPLTGLLNRRGLEEEAARMLAKGAAELSIVYLDLDGFKAVNDQLGHAEGDRALQTTASILLETFRAADAVGRIGGDEFVIVVAPGSDALVAARRLELHLDTWRHADDRDTLRAAIGVGHVTSATLDGFWEAVDAADRRMYRQKPARQARQPLPSAGGPMVPALS
jgi:diguanylate cyclase (GGDEF)-like protein